MKKSLLILLLVFANSIAYSQEDTLTKVFPFGFIETFYSNELDEERVLNIYVPDGYHPDSLHLYPTVYVLDGSYNEDFPHIAGLVQFMNMYDLMPKSIVVGIANVDRYRDFTSLSKVKEDIEAIPNNGGAKKFIRFLENEVQPLIDKKYKSNGHKSLIGQSLGGLMVCEILMSKPQLFNDYIIVSPSLWWNNEELVNRAAIYFKENQDLNKKVYVSLGKEHPVMHKVADQFVAAIKDSKNKNIKLFYRPILDEDHATILHLAVYNAFKTLKQKKSKAE
jgi:predicted alpha/beta superfamily hydrolase